MSRWEFEKVGMGYRCWSDVIGTEFRFTHIKRGRETLSGEVAVRTAIEGIKTINGVMHVARINILSGSTRKGLADLLKNRSPGIDVDWMDGLEHLTQGVIIAEQTGETFEEVGQDPKTPISKQFLVEPLILKGRPAMIFGPGGVGKSLIALTCAMSISAHREIIPGIKPAEKGSTLYLDWETTRDVVNDRVQSIAKGHGFEAPKIIYRRCIKPLADDAERLAEVIAERDVKLVVVDSAAYAMGSSGEYGDANESVLRMHEALRLMNTTALIVDHVNKTDTKSKPGSATPYGSAYKTWAARISWEIRKGPEVNGGLMVNLYHAKSNDTAQMQPMGLELDWDTDVIRFKSISVVSDQHQEEEQPVKRSCSKKILDLLAGGERINRNAIPGLVNEDSANVRQAIHRLSSSNKILIDEDGWVEERTNVTPLVRRQV